MGETGSDNRIRLARQQFINPALVQQMRGGEATGTVSGSGVEYGLDHYQITSTPIPDDGAEVVIREDDAGLYCKTVEQVEKEKREREQRQREKERKRKHEQARKEDRRRAEALRFWQGYDIPFEYDVRIKVRRSGLLRGSNGTGRAKDTVEHLYVREGFEDGRLARSADRYLCDDSAHIRDQDTTTASDSDGNRYERRVTCKACLDLMDRWEQQGSEAEAEP